MVIKKLSQVTRRPFLPPGITRPFVDLIGCAPSEAPAARLNKGDRAMSKMTKIAVSAAIILSTAFSALAANAGAREQAASSGTGVAFYDSHGGIVSGRWR